MTEEEPEYERHDVLPPVWKFPVCPDCGLQHIVWHAGNHKWIYSCNGHKRFYDEYQDPPMKYWLPCRGFRYSSGVICIHHGGKNPRNEAGMASRQENAELMERLRLEIIHVKPEFLEQHPIQGLLEEVGRSAQAVRWLAEQVARLHVEDPEEGMMAALVGFDENGEPVGTPNRFQLLGVDHHGDLAAHPYWKMLNSERDRHARLCKLALDAGVNERLVNLAQGQAVQMVNMLVTTLNSIGLTPDQIEAAKANLAERIRHAGPSGQIAAIEANIRG